MAAVLYPMRIGAASTSPSTPTFAGITKAQILTGGLLKVSWAAGTGTITSYKIYVREASASVFSDTYWVQSIDNAYTSTIIHLEADNATFLKPNTQYYVGVRAVNDTAEDSNTVTLEFYVAQNHVHFPLPINAHVVD